MSPLQERGVVGLFVSQANEIASSHDLKLQPQIARFAISCITLQHPNVELFGFVIALATKFSGMHQEIK